jgi:hypothetical protein
MRVLFFLLLSLVSSACSTTIKGEKVYPAIYIDGDALTASSPDWTSALVDCTNDEFRCLEAPGRFLIAFPKICPTEHWQWNIAGYPFRLTAPEAHYGLPSGGYFSEKYPYVYLMYRSRVGFRTLWIRSQPITTENWGGSSVEEYEVKFLSEPMLCE